jgi:hypothetical protein
MLVPDFGPFPLIHQLKFQPVRVDRPTADSALSVFVSPLSH